MRGAIRVKNTLKLKQETTVTVSSAETLRAQIRDCRLCQERFAATRTAHAPRPVTWFESSARILVIGQAPGLRVHQSGTPFLDRSGDRLRDWMGVDAATFYDRSRIAIVPMAFCFPGYSAAGADLPPPRICAETWHPSVMTRLPGVRMTLLIGGYAQRHYLRLPASARVAETVANWRQSAPAVIPLPHPSWRNSGWLKRHPWFEEELLPELRHRIAALL